MKRLPRAACAFAVVLTASPVLAQTGTISGTITDAVTHAPVWTGVTVQRYHIGQESVTVVSPEADGHYQFTGVTPGTYFLRIVTAPGYVPELHDDIACVADDCRPEGGTPVVVSAGATATVDFALAQGGAFSGTVRNASNNSAAANVFVQVFNASTSFVTTVVPDAGGAYVVHGLPAGTYFARATYSSGTQPLGLAELYGGIRCPSFEDPSDVNWFRRVHSSCRIASGTPIVVAAGNTTTGIDFSLDETATIAGRVVEQGTTSPIAGVTVAAFSGDVPVGSAQTVASGHYLITGLAPGFYQLRTMNQGVYVDAWHPGFCVGCPGFRTPVEVTLGADLTGLDFSLARGESITGTINCVNATFVIAPTISAYSPSGELVRSSVESVCSSPNALVGYRIDGLRPGGHYYLLARDRLQTPFGIQPWGGSLVDKLHGDIVCNTVDCDVRRGLPVMVNQGIETSGINFVVPRGADSTVLSDLQPLRMFDSRGVEMVGVVRRNISPPPGGWDAVGLPPGIYYAKYGNRLHGGIVCTDCPPTSGKPIVIKPGDTSFAFDFGSATPTQLISGTVTDGTSPLSTIAVELMTDGAQLFATVLTDQFGRYSIADVPPGTYFLRTRNDRGYADEIYLDVACSSCDPRMGAPMVVAASDLSGIDFSLAFGGVIAGEVTNPVSRMVVAGVPISIFTPTGALAGRAVSGGAGGFRVNVPAGSYRARTEVSAGSTAEIYQEIECSSLACDVTAGTPIPVTTGNVTSGINFTSGACGTITLSPQRLASAVVGVAYRQVFTATNGSAPRLYRISAGGLPPGLTLNALTGVLSGTPALPGRYEFTLGVLGGWGCGFANYALDVQECAFTLSPAGATVGAAGGTVTIGIGNSCGAQTVDVSGTFATVQSNTSGQVVLAVPANTNPAARVAAITIGRRVFELRQGGTALQVPFGSFDAPLDGSQVSGSIPLGGWALDDLEVRRVQIFRDPVGGEGGAQIFLGNAVFVRGARPDVAQAFATYPLSDRAGWGFLILTNMLPNQGNGPFRIYAYAEDAEGGRTLLGAKTIIAANSTATNPFGAIDTPTQGATIAGASYINFGWALTPQPKIIPTDGSTIHVVVDGVSLGNSTYNLFRADVSGLFPGLANSGGPVGYKIIDTTALAEGQHTIAWIVYDNLGAGAGIGSRYFNVANSADAQPAESAGVESGRRTESLATMPVAESRVTALGHSEEPAPIPEAADGTRVVRLAPLERLELQLEKLKELQPEKSRKACAATWAGYEVEKNTLGPLPVGATLDSSGAFFWQPGPGFIGTYELLFVRTACDGGKSQLPVKVTIGR